jgi:O-antigen ligase
VDAGRKCGAGRGRADKAVGPALMLSLVLMLLTFGSYGLQFYLYWVVGGVLVAIGASFTAASLKIKRDVLWTLTAMLAWVGYALLVSWSAIDLSVHLKMLVLCVFYTLSSVLVVGNLSNDLRSFARAFRVVTLAWVAVNTFFLIIYWIGLIDYGDRAFSGPYFNRNTLAVVGCLLLAVWLFATDVQFTRGINWMRPTMVFMLATLVIWSGSTKGIVGLGLIGVMHVLFSYRGWRAPLVLLVSGVIATSVVVTTEAGSRLTEKVAELSAMDGSSRSEGGSGLERLWLITESMRIIQEHPLTGIGVHNSQYYLFTPRYFREIELGARVDDGIGVYSHSNFTEMLLNAGWPAFLLYYVPVALLLIYVWKARPRSVALAKVRQLILVLLLLKVFFDVGMVSYYEFSHVLVLAVTFLLWRKYLRGGDIQAGFAAEQRRAILSAR